ncbi:long-chain-fatty-acid-CoA ligase [Neoconidiobolus thromboides FSU 785]|nr:long-chain-fatty-acid-CoA ligase [Neoconidiobolus thromboides FSU 785]
MTAKVFACELPNTRKPGQTGIYMNANSIEPISDKPHPRTLYELFVKAYQKAPDSDFLGTREKQNNKLGDYCYQSYKEVYGRASDVSSGLEYLVQEHDLYTNKEIKTIGIFSNNRSEWVISELAMCFRSYTTVGIYDTYGKERLNHIISHSEIEILILNKRNLLFLQQNNINLHQIKVLICFDEIVENDDKINFTNWAENKNIKLTFFNEIESLGKANPFIPNPPKPDSIYVIAYTSGTTGLPKGVMSTHSNYLDYFYIKSEDYKGLDLATSYSYMPLAHTYERANLIGVIACQGRAGFNSGSMLNFMDDIQKLRPTKLVTVPKILWQIYSSIEAACNSTDSNSSLLKEAIQQKLIDMKAGKGVESDKYDHIFKKFRESLGGEIALLTTASAPIPSEVLDTIKVVLSANIVEGYGSTEALGISMTEIYDSDSGSVGAPFPSVQIKLLDLPDKGYLSSDKPYPRGEICAKSPNVFKGYFKNEKATKEAFTEDGWFLTGDVGMVDEKGRLYVIDRKSNMLKLNDGFHVAPERIEKTINYNPLIFQSFIYCQPTDSYVVALIIPDEKNYLKWAQQKLNDSNSTMEFACKNIKLNSLLLEEIKDSCEKAGFASFEIPKYIHLHPTPFTLENGLLNDTFKIKRKAVKEEFLPIFERFYK